MTPDVAAAIADFVYRPGITAFETPDGFGAFSCGPSNQPVEAAADSLSVEQQRSPASMPPATIRSPCSSAS